VSLSNTLNKQNGKNHSD